MKGGRVRDIINEEIEGVKGEDWEKGLHYSLDYLEMMGFVTGYGDVICPS